MQCGRVHIGQGQITINNPEVTIGRVVESIQPCEFSRIINGRDIDGQCLFCTVGQTITDGKTNRGIACAISILCRGVRQLVDIGSSNALVGTDRGPVEGQCPGSRQLSDGNGLQTVIAVGIREAKICRGKGETLVF
ncbi:hypothetical protein, partial [Endozoicomonas elysicola]|uniref:hypothetical protein n=1 Tax=Endozoicomonas elysicola TaxID=305900 RepID=UPI001B7FE23D